jgi:hypothetical protein
MITWPGLLNLCPALEQFERDARSCAVHARWDWFPRWIGSFRDLRAALADVADQHHLDPEQVRQVAVAALKATYRATRQGQGQRRGCRQ